MAMTNTTSHDGSCTMEEYRGLTPSDEYLYELSDGILVREPRPGRPHGVVVARLCRILVDYADRHGGTVTTETGYVLSEDPLALRGPDAAWSAGDPTPYGNGDGFIRGAPDLAIEVVSRSNHASDIQKKVLEYFGGGARQVWVVHPTTRTVVVHLSRSEARILRVEETLEGGDLLPGLSVPVAELFPG